MSFQPRIRHDVKIQFAMLNRAVIPFANVCESENAGRFIRCDCRFTADILSGRSDHCESHGIPQALDRRPTATAGVSQVAEDFEDVLSRNLLFVSGSRAMPFPSTSQRQTRGMRPTAILHFLHRHEIRTGHASLSGGNFRDWTL